MDYGVWTIACLINEFKYYVHSKSYLMNTSQTKAAKPCLYLLTAVWVLLCKQFVTVIIVINPSLFYV